MGLPGKISEATARRAGALLHGFLLPHAVAFYTGALGVSDSHDSLTAVAGYILAHKLKKITNRDVARGDRAMRKLDPKQVEAVFGQLEAMGGWIGRHSWTGSGTGSSIRRFTPSSREGEGRKGPPG